MPSAWETLVASRAPVVGWRMDVTGIAANGDSIPDIYAGRHGVLRLDFPGDPPYGYPTGVETDPASKAMLIKVSGGGANLVSRPAYEAALQMGIDFTYEIFLNPHDYYGQWTTILGGYYPVMVNSPNSMGFTFVGTPGSAPQMPVRFQARIFFDDGSNAILTANGLIPEEGRWYHFVILRAGAGLGLFVNGILWASATVSAAPILTGSTATRVGNAQTVGYLFYADEFNIYNYALTPTQIRENYNALRLQQALRLRFNARATFTIDDQITPPPMDFAYRQNWQKLITERLEWETPILEGMNGDEQPYGVRGKPRRKLTYRVMLMNAQRRATFIADLWGTRNQPTYLPILSDKRQLEQAAVAGADHIFTETRYMDYEVGGLVQVWNDAGDLERHVILSIDDTLGRINFDGTTLANDWPVARTHVAPVVRAKSEPAFTFGARSLAVDETQFRADVMVEDMAATPRRLLPYVPTYTYRVGEDGNAVQVFDPVFWGLDNEGEGDNEVQWAQRQNTIDFGTGVPTHFTPHTGAKPLLPQRLVIRGRQKIAHFLHWLYGLEGRYSFLWVPSMRPDFEVTAVASGQITVKRVKYRENYALHQARRDVFFYQTNRTFMARRITGVSTVGNTEVLSLDGDPPALTSIRFTGFLLYCRLDHDHFEWAWADASTIRIELGFRALLVTV